MTQQTVRGVALEYEVIGDRRPWVALTPGSRRPYGELVPLSRRLAEDGYLDLMRIAQT